MTFFQQFLESKISNKVSISVEEYEKSLRERLENVVQREDFYNTESDKIAIEQTLLEQHYPNTDQFMLSIASNNPQKIQAAYKTYQNWNKEPLPEALFNYKINLYGKHNLNKQDILQSLLKETDKNMHKIGKIIEAASIRIPSWKSVIKIKPKEPTEWIYPADEAIIEISRPPAAGSFSCKLLPGFVEMDMLDENNDAFYADEGLQQDLYSLIKEIQKPRDKSPKILTLYFNAPLSERAIYTDAKRKLAVFGYAEVPSKPMTETVEESIHDTWKIRVNSKYLNEYNIPVKYIELIKEGTS